MQLPLKLNSREKQELLLKEDGSYIEYYPSFLSEDPLILDHYFDELKFGLNWKQDQISLYGKTHEVPRLQSWYSDEGKSYTYSGIKMDPIPFHQILKEFNLRFERELNLKTNSVLCNLYRSGHDYVAWHSDDEKELGENPIIISLSLGESRRFILRHKKNKEEKYEYLLGSGDLLIMRGKTQAFYEHQVPRTSKSIGERINLTFRTIDK